MTVSEVLKGIGIVAGTAIGKIKVLSEDLSRHLHHYSVEAPVREVEKFLVALNQATEQVEKIIENANKHGEDKQAGIMEAHLAMLGDPMLKEAVLQKIKDSMSAPQAVLEVTQEYAAEFAAIDDQYLLERSADVLDIGRRIAKILLDVRGVELGSEPIILFARDIEPSVLTDISSEVVTGLILEHGSTTSHAVIIAKAKGIITVVGVPGSLKLLDGIQVALDGTSGEVVLSPDKAELGLYLARIREERERYVRDLANASLPAVTVDGKRVQLAVNISTPQDMEQALMFGCDGVGLYRTEFLFMGRNNFPTEEEQFQAYREVAEKCGENLCVIRTLDIGGDKPLSYLDIDQESNPFLGWRAIRISLERTDLFVTQLKAILRAGVYGNVALMLPMVISSGEIRRAKECLGQAMSELEHEDKDFARSVPLGIMVETPAAAVIAPHLAKECDFFSIGTNDLVQYTLAVDRGNQKVRKLYNYFHPAVLRLIDGVISAAHDQGIWAGMCGEMAGDPLAAILLVGMGIDELSMNATAMPKVRELIRGIDVLLAKDLLQQVLSLDDGVEIREYLVKALKN
ncbi:Phosphoenolpyruvate-protein phosphotransferase of PTS system [Desulfosporosinus metallidurans]|uniref:Phosphoenolpyruvate-protein phosphotransferase n=1 Tax=Desulfosporosinus metallidurans TaxID=1888891 RepID=A0A1Q8R2I9_9FIRM|nr:Phosphoenolpyruvate-protein phosphotransferase of PTS system [Desulfosporosinus metallidurans]